MTIMWIILLLLSFAWGILIGCVWTKSQGVKMYYCIECNEDKLDKEVYYDEFESVYKCKKCENEVDSLG